MSADAIQFLINGTAYGAQLGLLAAGFGLVYAVRKVFHVFYGATFMLGAYAAVWATIGSGGRLWVGLLAAVVVAVLAGLFVDVVAYRGLKMNGQTEGASVPISLACYVIAVAAVSLVLGSAPVGLPPGLNTVWFRFFSVRISTGQVASFGVGALAAVCAFQLRRSVAGLALRAVADDVPLAATMGISARLVGLRAITISGVLAGAAAWCYAIDGAVIPNVGARDRNWRFRPPWWNERRDCRFSGDRASNRYCSAQQCSVCTRPLAGAVGIRLRSLARGHLAIGTG